VTALTRSTPEAQGVSPAAVLALIDALGAAGGTHSLMVLRHGAVIAECWWEPFTPTDPHSLYSVSKSFTSAAIGIAVGEGLLTVDDRVIDLLPDDAPAVVSEHLAAMRVRHLLTMTTGHDVDLVERLHPQDPGWARAILAQPVDHEPGTHFVYNTPATYLLSAILQRLTGLRLLDYLEPRLLAPLGIVGATAEQSPDGVDIGGYGMAVTTEDLARFGQLLLQRGAWEGAQLIPAEWVDEATSAITPSAGDSPDWEQGYGYQFWRGRHDTARADGAFGQFVVLVPDSDLVVVTTSGTMETRATLSSIWEHLLPAIAAEPVAAELPTRRTLPTPAASNRSIDGDYFFPTNPLKITRLSVHGQELTIDDRVVPFTAGDWVRGGTFAVDGLELPVAASGGWVDDDHFVVELVAYETPFSWLLDLSIVPGAIDLRVTRNASFDPNRQWRLVGGVLGA